MILDTIDMLEAYQDSFPYSFEVLEYLVNTDMYQLELGTYEILGEDVFVIVQEYSSVIESEKVWESHRKYLDLQIVLTGEEYMCFSTIDRLSELSEYDELNDVTNYSNTIVDYSLLHVPANSFCIFFPEDGHKPGITKSIPTLVKKAVIKIAAE